MRRAVLRNLADEEMEGRAHSELWLDFAEGMGADREEVRGASRCRKLRKRSPVPQRGARGHDRRSAGRVLRLRVAGAAGREEKAEGLAQRYGADRKTCGYFEAAPVCGRGALACVARTAVLRR